METRLRYYDPQKGRALFHAQWEINEFLVDPKLADVLPRLRSMTDQAFYFITNGSPLKANIIELLRSVKPVHLIISVNSLDRGLRANVMQENGFQTATALDSLERLVAHRIPFGISLAAFPEFSFADLERTIRLANDLPAAFVRINLPGYTRELPYNGNFETDEYWMEIVKFIRDLRPNVRIPLITIPSAFEENYLEDPLAPRILGSVPGSPANRAGLMPNDRIVAVNSIEIGNRAELLSLLLLMRGRTEISVQRGTSRLSMQMDATVPGEFPYDGPVMCKYLFPHGVVAAPGLGRRLATEVCNLIDENRARRCWIVTSRLMLPAARLLLERYAPAVVGNVDFVVADNEYLGGNIRILDMCTIGDIASALSRKLERENAPDLVLLSESGFNYQGRDLQGRHWGDLERWFEFPIRLLTSQRFSY